MMIGVPEKYALEVSSPTPIISERQHEEYLPVLDKLASKDNPTSDEEKYAEVLTTLIEAYEEEHHSLPDAPPVEVLCALMDADDLRQKDQVPIFGSESIVSEVLHKKRALNKTHIEKLSKQFRVSPAVFFSRTMDRQEMERLLCGAQNLRTSPRQPCLWSPHRTQEASSTCRKGTVASR